MRLTSFRSFATAALLATLFLESAVAVQAAPIYQTVPFGLLQLDAHNAPSPNAGYERWTSVWSLGEILPGASAIVSITRDVNPNLVGLYT